MGNKRLHIRAAFHELQAVNNSYTEFTRTSKEACGIPPMNQYVEFQVTGIIMTTLAFVFYILRVTCKILGPTFWGIDDTLISVSAAVLSPICVFYQLLLEQGLGKDFENLSHRQVATFFRVSTKLRFLARYSKTQYFFAFGLLYHIALTCIKTSILLLYLQIFPDETFRRVVKWTVTCNALFGLTFVVLTLIQAPVLLGIWKAWEDKTIGESMHYISWPSLVQACLNLALDIWMLILPISQLYKMGLKIRKKLGVIAMFSVGIFLTIVCALKLYKMVEYVTDISKSTQNGNDVIFWSYIELCVGITVSCMPHTRQLTRAVLHRLQSNGCGIRSSGSDGPFITRSIETITQVSSPLDTVVLHDEGNLLTKS
ncbi:integral membrane protein [Fusarium fujikuroi]|nr:integral membrane protein [Fusarium fujikuroi]